MKKKFSKNWHTARHRNEGRGVCQFLLNFFLEFSAIFLLTIILYLNYYLKITFNDIIVIPYFKQILIHDFSYKRQKAHQKNIEENLENSYKICVFKSTKYWLY